MAALSKSLKTRQLTTVTHYNLRLPDVALVVLYCFWPNLYSIWLESVISRSCQNSDTVIRFNNPKFLKQTNNLAIR